MTILVTGASGFIGRRAMALLCERRDDVIGASRTRPKSLPANARHEAVDLLAPGATTELIRRVRPSRVLHLAWNAEPGKFWSAQDNLIWSAATLELVHALSVFGAERLVAAGTCAEYDWSGDGLLAEGSPTRPMTLYGRAKDATRRLACAEIPGSSLSVAWGRVFWLYGPEEAAGRLVSDVARALVEGRPVDVSEGRQTRDFLHVDDVAGAFVAALNDVWCGPFNIGSGEPVPVRDILGMLGSVAGRPELIHFGARSSPNKEEPWLVADPSILRDVIGYRPKFSLADGIRSTFEWWYEQQSRSAI